MAWEPVLDMPYRRKQDPDKNAPTQVNPTEGMSTWDLFRAGAGKHFYDVGRAAGQMIPVYRNGEWTTLVTPEDVDKSRVQDAPLMATTPGATGYNTTAGLLALATSGRNIPQAVASGMTWGALQPTGSQDSRAANMAMGTALEAGPDLALVGVGRGVKNLMGGFSGSTTGSQRRELVHQMQQDNFKVSPGQATGKTGGAWGLEDWLRQSPWGSVPFNRADIHNTTMLNRKVARSFGESSDVVDAATLNRAHTRLGRFFNGVSKNPITLDEQFLRAVDAIDPDKIATWTKNDKLAEVIARARGAAAPTSPGTSPVMDWNAPGPVVHPTITGEEYKTIRSGLDQTAQSLLQAKEGTAAYGIWKVMDALDGAMERSLGTETRRAWRQARREYRNLIMAEDMVTRTSAGRIGGNVESVAQVVKGGKNSARRLARTPPGVDPMIDAARYADVLHELPPGSPTARRLQWQQILPMGGGAGTGAAAGAILGGGFGAAAGAAGGLAVDIAGEQSLANMLLSPKYFDYFAGYNGGLPLPFGLRGKDVATGMEQLDPYVLQLLGSYPLGQWMGSED